MKTTFICLLFLIKSLSLFSQTSAIHKTCQNEIDTEARVACTIDILKDYIINKIKESHSDINKYEAKISLSVSKRGLIKYHSSTSTPDHEREIISYVNDLSYTTVLLPATADNENVASTISFSFKFNGNGKSTYDTLTLSDNTSNSDSLSIDLNAPKETDKIHKVVDIMPRFPGCELNYLTDKQKEKCSKELLVEYIYNNIEYPESVISGEIEGMSIVKFVINQNGTLSDFKITRELCEECSTNIIKLMNSMPLWKSGEHNGMKVRVLYTLPIKFRKKK